MLRSLHSGTILSNDSQAHITLILYDTCNNKCMQDRKDVLLTRQVFHSLTYLFYLKCREYPYHICASHTYVHVCTHTYTHTNLSLSSRHRHFLYLLDALLGKTVYKPQHCVCPAWKQDIQPGQAGGKNGSDK